MNRTYLWIMAVGALSHLPLVAQRACDVCKLWIQGEIVYTTKDRVTGEKRFLWPDCIALPRECATCGLPVKTGYRTLDDSRFLCQRDAKDALLDVTFARQLCLDQRQDLDRLFSRFLILPHSNVELEIGESMVRVQLMNSGERITLDFKAE